MVDIILDKRGLGGNRICSTIDELTLRLGKLTGNREDIDEADGMDSYS